MGDLFLSKYFRNHGSFPRDLLFLLHFAQNTFRSTWSQNLKQTQFKKNLKLMFHVSKTESALSYIF